jgi:6-phosphogluconolactonase (cycloisomerase 2 family)
MAATVPAQFLFLGQSDAPLVTAFRINSDGSLAPVAGSPFAVGAAARELTFVGNTLTVASEAGVQAFTVDKETGSIHEGGLAKSLMAPADASMPANSAPQKAVLDSQGRFMFVADVNRAELLVFRVDNGKPVALSSAAIPISSATSSMAVVKP